MAWGSNVSYTAHLFREGCGEVLVKILVAVLRVLKVHVGLGILESINVVVLFTCLLWLNDAQTTLTHTRQSEGINGT